MSSFRLARSTGPHVLLLVALALSAPGCDRSGAAPGSASPGAGGSLPGCGKDTDCKGDRICESGTCTSAPSAPERGMAAPLPRGAPGTAQTEQCPEGIVAADGWPGDYPGPIVYVEKSTQLRGWVHPCAPEPTVKCQVPPGLYHPWSRVPSRYVAVHAIYRFETLAPVVVGGIELAAGAPVDVFQYAAQEQCVMGVAGKTLVDTCPSVEPSHGGGALFRELPGRRDVPDRHFFEAACVGGPKAWIEASRSIFNAPGVSEGEILGYGRVGAPLYKGRPRR